MGYYTKRPVTVEAIQYDPNDLDAVKEFVGDRWNVDVYPSPNNEDYVQIHTIDGNDADVLPGWWIVRGTAGELYPCKADIFAATYDPVEV